MSARLGIVVLAAERSDRMRSSLPPALHTIAGVPAAQYVIDAARELSPARIVVVAGDAGHGREALAGADLVFVAEGRGFAEYRDALDGCDSVLIARGDAPLVESALLRALTEVRGHAPLAFATSVDGEQAGPWCADAAWLWAHLDPEAEGGNVLASLAEAARAEEYPAPTVTADADARLCIDDRAKLAEAEAIVRGRLIAEHLAAGVTFRDPATVYLDRNVRLEPDVRIEPNCYLYGETSVAAGAVIGPGATLRNATIGGGSSVEHSVVED